MQKRFVVTCLVRQFVKRMVRRKSSAWIYLGLDLILPRHLEFMVWLLTAVCEPDCSWKNRSAIDRYRFEDAEKASERAKASTESVIIERLEGTSLMDLT